MEQELIDFPTSESAVADAYGIFCVKGDYMSTLSSMRDGGYKQAVRLADRTLIPSLPNTSVKEFTDVAVKAMNACGHWAKRGKIRLRYQGHAPLIEILVGGRVRTPNPVQELLLWADPNSVMEFLAAGSGIARTFNPEPNPF